MEAATTARGGSLPMQPSQQSRKEWRAVSEHHSVRNAGNEELERSKLGQSDERTIYEVQQGREPLDDFRSITINKNLDNDILQQRLHDVDRQREELQHMEIELRAQIIARSEILEMQNRVDVQIKENTNAVLKLQDQLHEKEHTIHELERKLEDKDRELHTVKLDTQAAWAKEDVLREQGKELATYRRERDHSEAERAQHMKQIHDLQEHIQEKERQLIELQEQHRVAQETILYRDEQLREIQAWAARAQERDAVHSTTNHSLQAELRERTEQYNQLWLGFQQQCAEMERLHVHTIQQLQLELAEARERSGSYNDESHVSQTNSKDASQYVHMNGSQLDLNGSAPSSANTDVLSNSNSDNVPSFASSGNALSQSNHVPGVPIAPSSLLGMTAYLPPGQVTALHPFVVHQQGAPHSVSSHVPHSHVGQFHSIPAISSIEQWQNQQAVSEGSQISTQNDLQPSQNDQNIMRSDAKLNYEMSDNGQALHPDPLDAHISQRTEPDSVLSSSTGETQVESIDRGYLVGTQHEQSLQQISSQFHDALRLDPLQQNIETKEHNVVTSINHGVEGKILNGEQPSSSMNTLLSDSSSIHSANPSETTINTASGAVLHEAFVSIGQTNSLAVGNTSEPSLLDERSLLACIVRTIPPGGRIRISSTLPNRLGKMLAPLHWHDYKKKYGKLDDFVGSHPELFLIERDYIQLREGAQEMIAATAAVAKVAAAAAASSPPSYLPSVAVTPMAQAHRHKKVPSADSRNTKTDKSFFKEHAVMQNQHPNGVISFGVGGGLSNVKLLSKSNDSRELNDPESTSSSQSTVLLAVGNGAAFDGSSNVSSNESAGSANGRPSSHLAGKQHGRRQPAKN